MTVSTLWSIIIAIASGIAAIAGAIKIIKPSLLKPITNLQKKIDGLAEESRKSDTEIKTALKDIDGQVATMQREKMMWAYSYYGIKHHPISLESRTSLQDMYAQYTEDNKHNHIPKDFIEKIHSAPLEGVK